MWGSGAVVRWLKPFYRSCIRVPPPFWCWMGCRFVHNRIIIYQPTYLAGSEHNEWMKLRWRSFIVIVFVNDLVVVCRLVSPVFFCYTLGVVLGTEAFGSWTVLAFKFSILDSFCLVLLPLWTGNRPTRPWFWSVCWTETGAFCGAQVFHKYVERLASHHHHQQQQPAAAQQRTDGRTPRRGATIYWRYIYLLYTTQRPRRRAQGAFGTGGRLRRLKVEAERTCLPTEPAHREQRQQQPSNDSIVSQDSHFYLLIRRVTRGRSDFLISN